jgi:hypothetical protein
MLFLRQFGAPARMEMAVVSVNVGADHGTAVPRAAPSLNRGGRRPQRQWSYGAAPTFKTAFSLKKKFVSFLQFPTVDENLPTKGQIRLGQAKAGDSGCVGS